MANLSTETNQGAAGRKFADLMQHGDDFFRIELWRHARVWYRKALNLNLETEKVTQKIADCDRLVTRELKIILILVAIASTIILFLFIVL